MNRHRLRELIEERSSPKPEYFNDLEQKIGLHLSPFLNPVELARTMELTRSDTLEKRIESARSNYPALPETRTELETLTADIAARIKRGQELFETTNTSLKLLNIENAEAHFQINEAAEVLIEILVSEVILGEQYLAAQEALAKISAATITDLINQAGKHLHIDAPSLDILSAEFIDRCGKLGLDCSGKTSHARLNLNQADIESLQNSLLLLSQDTDRRENRNPTDIYAALQLAEYLCNIHSLTTRSAKVEYRSADKAKYFHTDIAFTSWHGLTKIIELGVERLGLNQPIHLSANNFINLLDIYFDDYVTPLLYEKVQKFSANIARSSNFELPAPTHDEIQELAKQLKAQIIQSILGSGFTGDSDLRDNSLHEACKAIIYDMPAIKKFWDGCWSVLTLHSSEYRSGFSSSSAKDQLEIISNFLEQSTHIVGSLISPSINIALENLESENNDYFLYASLPALKAFRRWTAESTDADFFVTHRMNQTLSEVGIETILSKVNEFIRSRLSYVITELGDDSSAECMLLVSLGDENHYAQHEALKAVIGSCFDPYYQEYFARLIDCSANNSSTASFALEQGRKILNDESGLDRDRYLRWNAKFRALCEPFILKNLESHDHRIRRLALRALALSPQSAIAADTLFSLASFGDLDALKSLIHRCGLDIPDNPETPEMSSTKSLVRRLLKSPNIELKEQTYHLLQKYPPVARVVAPDIFAH